LRIRVSCSTKLHSFQLAEQLAKRSSLDKLYTSFHSQVNVYFKRIVKRRDHELIPVKLVKTFPYLAFLIKLTSRPFEANHHFDRIVSSQLKKDSRYDLFIGWSGMSLLSMKQARKDGKKVVLERGSSHITFQIPLLEEEYDRWGFKFKRDQRVIDQELEEYQLADSITVPSVFVEQTFIQMGIPREKLFINNFGASSLFKQSAPKRSKFTIVYLGQISLRKGMPYLFQALASIKDIESQFEVWFIGSVSHEVQQIIPKYVRPNWKFYGYIPHHQLSNLISQASIAIQPSLEEGLSMVIPQLMACGVPVLASQHTGAADLITHGIDGWIMPIRSPEHIAERIRYSFNHPYELEEVQKAALSHARTIGTWEAYGSRYISFLGNLLNA
jgi:glycosyltransferase involved in cell wall biosynthesis